MPTASATSWKLKPRYERVVMSSRAAPRIWSRVLPVASAAEETLLMMLPTIR